MARSTLFQTTLFPREVRYCIYSESYAPPCPERCPCYGSLICIIKPWKSESKYTQVPKSARERY